MRFLSPLRNELDFDLHVESLNNESFVERKWLQEVITETLHTSDSGVLITADMGYGKSSFVSNLICAESSSTWYDLRKQILAYHFCRYDMVMTINADTFIRNLASAIVNKYPEMGNAILRDEMASDFLDPGGFRCTKDPIACFELGILSPLRNKWPQQKFIIIIDALDECSVGGGRNTLLDFLYTQMHRFPANFTFILTSRNIEYIHRKFPKMSRRYLNASSDDNMNDIRQYIKKTIQITDHQTNTLTKVSSGNFQHVKHYLQYCLKATDCDFTKIPESLEELYQFNFERIFKGTDTLFDELTPVFEVLCTLQNPIDEEQLLSISNISTQDNKRKIEKILGNELGHFIKNEDGKISFLHKSISDFLTDQSRNHLQFFIHKKNGHKRFADYLFKTLNISTTLQDNIAELIHHVAMSGNSDYETMLFAYVKSLLQKDRQLNLKLLFQVVRDYNSYHTSELVLTLTNLKEVNEVDNNSHSLSFVAARQGNEESLKCLLDRGANPNFTVILEKNMHIVDGFHKSHHLFYSGHNSVQVCKYVYFCGYNILQIASQNGHKRVVKMLLDRHKRLAYVENDMHLNAFHLAVENGHFEIMSMFLEMNSSLADIISLYQASKNGYLNIVETLLSYGVIDQCVPCNGTFYWLPLISNRKQQGVKINNIKTEYRTFPVQTYFYDDWRLITCETALNTAVRKGHLDVVKSLMKEKDNALWCTTYDGKTPLMTAVRYGRTEIFQLLHAKNATMSRTCVHSFNIFDIYFLAKLDIWEREELIAERCPSGASVVHLLAIHGNIDMLLFMYQSGFSDWDLKDTDNATPLHYAFCHNTIVFIVAAHKLKLNFTARTLNMSTIFHSAAICKSFSLYFFSKHEDYKLNVPDVVDKDGRSILHYSMLMPLDKDGRVMQGKTRDDGYIFDVCFDFRHDFHLTDHEGRNFLHYAAKSGNYYGFHYASRMLSGKDIGLLLKKKDTMGRTPLDEVFYSMPKHETFEVLKIPSGCEIEDVFYTFCGAKHDLILTDHEMVIWEIALYLNKHGGFSEYNITDMLFTSIRKSRVYPILILKTYASDAFKHSILSSPDILNVVTQYEGPNIAEFILTTENALNCNGGVSPLHRIIFNDRNTQWRHCNVEFLIKYLSKFTAQNLNLCFDSDGYNLLHRAIMGGNIIATQYLVKKGMNTSKTSLSGLSPLFISVTKAPYLENSVLPSYCANGSTIQILQFILENTTTNVITDSYGVIDYDTTSAFILRTLYQSKNISPTVLAGDLCNGGEKKLGLIHLAAAKGLVTFLKKSRSLFGSNILNCHDYNNITPLYLAQIYNQTIVIQWMKSIQIHRVQPKSEVESLLIYNFLSNYRTFRIFDWTCRLQYNYRHAGLILLQVKKCLRMVTKHDYPLLYRNPLHTNIFHIIFTSLQSLDSFKIATTGLQLCERNTIDICSSFNANVNLARRTIKALHKVVYISLRKQIKFGSFDRIYLYQFILRYVLKQSEMKYVKELSFHSVFSLHFRYLENLIMRKDIHTYWLSQLTEHLQMKYNFTIQSYLNRELKLMLWLNSLSLVPGLKQLLRETNERVDSEIKDSKKNHQLSCEDCAISIELFLENYGEICSVMDVFELESLCVEEMTYNPDIMSEVKLPSYTHNFITVLINKAKTDPNFKKKVKLYQRNSSMILYFMQFIPEYRKLTPCMRFITHIAEKSIKMRI